MADSQDYLTFLNKLLIIGINLRNEIIYENRNNFIKYIFAPFYLIGYKNEIKQWVKEVTDILEKHYPTHYLTHFVRQPSVEKKIADVSWILSPLMSDLESYIEALEKIIWTLEENENNYLKKELEYKKMIFYILSTLVKQQE